MGTVNIKLMGICTNFRVSDHPELPVQHRVVLIRADNLPSTVFGHVIPPHFASLVISGDTPGGATIPLAGVDINVKNEVDADCVYSESFLDTPTLTSLMGGVLNQASLPVLVGKNKNLVSAYLNLNSGSFTACALNNAATTTITVTTSDVNPTLLLTPFPTAAYPAPTPMEIEIPSGGTVVLQNVSADETDGTFHFLLHYLTVDIPPESPVVPTTLNLGACPGPAVGGVGCSDSNYP